MEKKKTNTIQQQKRKHVRTHTWTAVSDLKAGEVSTQWGRGMEEDMETGSVFC